MGMKFLNKKGWHTGSLRNIENVWKAEQKHEQEQKKLEELRKQIKEEREKSEFRQLQEQAGLVPRQERLEFLYESGLGVGKGSSSSSEVVFKALEQPAVPPPPPPSSSSSAATQQPLVPGALFEEKAQSANDSWRKLHSDPLLLIRQREQESMARLKNNPVQMAMIRNSVEATKSKEKKDSKEKGEKKRHKKKSRRHRDTSPVEEEERTDVRVSKRNSKGDELLDKTDHVPRSEQRNKHHRDSSSSAEEEERSTFTRGGGGKRSRGDERSGRMDCVYEKEERNDQRRNHRHHRDSSPVQKEERSTFTRVDGKGSRGDERSGRMDRVSEREERHDQRRNHHHHRDSSPVQKEERSKYTRDDVRNTRSDERSDKRDCSYEREERKRNVDKPKYEEKDKGEDRHSDHQAINNRRGSSSNPGPVANHRRPPRHSSKLSAEERAARLREMQIDAEVHEENRWKRIKKADEIDTLQEAKAAASMAKHDTEDGNSKNFLDAAKRSVYGAEKGGSSTVEESILRRTHFRQSQSEVGQGNAFRR